MICPANFEQKIGFDRVRSQVEAQCSSPAAKRKLYAENFLDSSHIEQLIDRLSRVDELLGILRSESGFPCGEYPDISSVVAKTRVVGTFLETEEIVLLRSALDSVAEIVAFFESKEEGLYPYLATTAQSVATFPHIVGHIDTIIDRFGEVKDSASAELYSIRRSIRSRQGEAGKRLRAILAEAQSAGIVDSDATVSIRDGRAVIPVLSNNKRKLNGLIQGQSATGRTYYVEPMEVVEINNELRELEYAERHEVVRILSEFTDWIRGEIDQIEQSGEFLTTMDMIRAKARWALEMECVKPIISTEGRLELRKARHPLLQQNLQKEGRELVPLDIVLDRERHIAVISGPNAGGKSVCLKCVGIVQYMFQCGFLVPALENSELPVFDSLFIDIGDQQSIDNDLSTYSSHLLNMKTLLQNATADSLVLIDEFGSGTEPIIGGAIAEAILEQLVERGTYGVITTHYSNIKYYASNTKGIANGAMMFDVNAIRPLFRLEMGTPGSSFAVEIARRIGLPESIIKTASEKAGSEHMNLERQLREIARDRRYWEQKRDRIRITDRRVEQIEADYAERLAQIKAERAEIIRTAKAEAQKIVAEANKQIENTIKTIRESQAEKELTRLARKELDEFKESMEQVGEKDAERARRIDAEMERVKRRQERRRERAEQGKSTSEPVVQKTVPKTEVEVGCKVRMAGQNVVGEVQSIKGKRAVVAFGQILSTVDKSTLTVISNSEYKAQIRPTSARTVVSVDLSARKLNFRDNIDVRGMRVDEALATVQNFIDDAIMVGIGYVSILHGKGSGALKDEIRRYLRSVPSVASYEDEHADRGGAGITIVRFVD